MKRLFPATRWQLVCGLLSVFFALAYMTVNVAGNYQGKWTGLFYIGQDVPLPAAVEKSGTHRVGDSKGYDAQYYYLIAHDPLFLNGTEEYMDNPPLRWRRIFVPALSFLIHAVTGIGVAWAYTLILSMFVFLGAWWMSQYVTSAGFHPLLGLSFLLIPATLISVDRMTVDLALSALTIGFVWKASSDDHRGVYGILCVAPLVRETGILLVVGWCCLSMWRKQWGSVIAGGLCSVPALAWWVYVRSRTLKDHTPWMAEFPFQGLIDRTLGGDGNAINTSWLLAAHQAENLTLAGVWLALFMGVFVLWHRPIGLMEITAALFVAFMSMLGKYDIWDSTYAIGRTLSPLLILLLLIALRDRRYVYALPMLLFLPRIGLQFMTQMKSATGL